MIFSCAKRRLPCHASTDFFRNEQYTSLGSFSSPGTRKRSVHELISNHSAPNPNHRITLLTRYSHRTIITVENPSTRIVWQHSRLVSEENSFHVRHHAFSRPFHAQIFVPRCQRRNFNHTFHRSYYRNGMIACGLCSFLQPSFGNYYSASCIRSSGHVFSHKFISRIENTFKPPQSD